MKILLVVGLILGAIIPLAGHVDEDKVTLERTVVSQPAKPLQVIVIAPKRRYRLREEITLPVMLFNSGKEDIFVFGTLGWGYSASFLLHVRDSSGNEIAPVGVPDDQTRFSSEDKNVLVRLVPNHFLGTNFFAPLNILNLNRPGRYGIFAEYQSPVSSSEVQVSPFWGKENGSIKSNVVWIEVVR